MIIHIYPSQTNISIWFLLPIQNQIDPFARNTANLFCYVQQQYSGGPWTEDQIDINTKYTALTPTLLSDQKKKSDENIKIFFRYNIIISRHCITNFPTLHWARKSYSSQWRFELDIFSYKHMKQAKYAWCVIYYIHCNNANATLCWRPHAGNTFLNVEYVRSYSSY